MSLEILLAFCTYAIVTSITPGPTNFMLLASGANFGFVRTIPHFLGVAFGFTIMVAAVGLGIGALLAEHPRVYFALKMAGIAYLLYLSWCLLRADNIEQPDKKPLRPMSFFMGALFPLVNPKAWIMAIGAIGTYVPNGSSTNALLIHVRAGIPRTPPCPGYGTQAQCAVAVPARTKSRALHQLLSCHQGLLEGHSYIRSLKHTPLASANKYKDQWANLPTSVSFSTAVGF